MNSTENDAAGEKNTNPAPSQITPSTENPQQENNMASKLVFNDSTIIASLSYLGPLVFIPFFTKKDDPFTKFHIKQGLIVFGLEALTFLINAIPFTITTLISLILFLFTTILSAYGIYQVLQQKEVMLPIIGKYSSRIDI